MKDCATHSLSYERKEMETSDFGTSARDSTFSFLRCNLGSACWLRDGRLLAPVEPLLTHTLTRTTWFQLA